MGEARTAEIWTGGAGVPGQSTRQAEAAERNGFDGITFVDSQNLAGDCYVALASPTRSPAIPPSPPARSPASTPNRAGAPCWASAVATRRSHILASRRP